MKRKVFIIALFCLSLLLTSNSLYDEKVTIAYTGGSYSNLYPCRCPKSPNGGVARRATILNKLCKEYPSLLLLDSGGYFGGGMQDGEKTTLELDKKRTVLNLEIMELLGYDVVGISKEEMNFGRDFLIDKIKDTGINFLACNIDLPGAAPFIIKEASSVKIGILAVAPLDFITENKQDFSDVLKTVTGNIEYMSKQGAEIVIVLSYLGHSLDIQLMEQVKGIDVLIGTSETSKADPEGKIGETLYLRPYYWAKTVKIAELDIADGKVNSFEIKQFPLSSDIVDDPEIQSLLPRCFSKKQCKKRGFVGSCESPGEITAKCTYEEQAKIPLLIIRPDSCKTCNARRALSDVQKNIPGIFPSFVNESSKRGKSFIKKYNIKLLPAFLLGRSIEREATFRQLLDKKIIQKKDNSYYLISPSYAGGSYFTNRKNIDGRLDLFISLYDKKVKNVLKVTKQLIETIEDKIDFKLHFLVFENKETGELVSKYGKTEVEEAKRALCIIEKYPDKTWDYLFCRIDNIESSWWDDCAKSAGIDVESIKECAKSQEAIDLIKNNIKLSKKLGVSYGPLFLLNNREIFGIGENTTVEELKLIVKQEEKDDK